MADKNGSTYTIKAGDTITSIARENNVADWEIIFGHDNNKQYSDANPDYDKLKIGEKLFIPPAELNAALQSGPQQAAVMPGNALFFDAHMHIQSNNCAPLPLQWAVMKKNALLRLKAARMAVNLSAGVATGRFGKIGAYSSDQIAIIYNQTGKNLNKHGGVLWKIFDYAASIDHYVNELFQTDKGLALLTGATDKDFEVNFKEATQFYFKNNHIERMAVCLLMDMSYSHYWGKFGLPINLPSGDSSVFINDFISGGLVLNSEKIYADFTSLTEKPIFEIPEPGWSHLYAKKLPQDTFSFKEQYNNFIEPKLISADEPYVPEKDSFIAFPTDKEESALNSRLINRDFVHIVQDLPESETRKFEDYSKQRLRSIKAAMTYPLKMVPFYHYDPRRHFDKEKRSALLGELQTNHAFFRLSGRSFAQKILDYSGQYLKLTPDKELNGADFFSKTLGMLDDNAAAFENLFFHPSSTKGVFWGVKMYPRLGFAPENYQDYPHLKEFYSACQNNKIPITTHCSRGGMFIADYMNNIRYGPKAGNPPDVASQVSLEYEHAEFWFADNYAAPANWEKVLKDHPQLTLNLAHFGGGDVWRWAGSFEDVERNFPSNPQKLPKGENPKGTDDERNVQDASLYYAWVRKIAELCNTYTNAYTDLSY
ncbi:MAG: LysM domain-containing protein, partial [Chitinivibrionales bacterium]